MRARSSKDERTDERPFVEPAPRRLWLAKGHGAMPAYPALGPFSAAGQLRWSAKQGEGNARRRCYKFIHAGFVPDLWYGPRRHVRQESTEIPSTTNGPPLSPRWERIYFSNGRGVKEKKDDFRRCLRLHCKTACSRSPCIYNPPSSTSAMCGEPPSSCPPTISLRSDLRTTQEYRSDQHPNLPTEYWVLSTSGAESMLQWAPTCPMDSTVYSTTPGYPCLSTGPVQASPWSPHLAAASQPQR
ncbi:uncharacterized protein C8Q71DRAFT_250531 [Rhodofomes roseus]|uniref:Uncharacterized protein n=1 Tax=Rhodofomes roseus TaxID=34475 RepID=A0ABQ8K7L8_9APHY|nr:uncharacterized protein C8Q71DRAFT_250531 [Rhodofomes roseus]KAH9833047.1 hypothetical protein C8Q71DRAFT_250531 [Rhodofomes roseus]